MGKGQTSREHLDLFGESEFLGQQLIRLLEFHGDLYSSPQEGGKQPAGKNRGLSTGMSVHQEAKQLFCASFIFPDSFKVGCCTYRPLTPCVAIVTFHLHN